jgi:hypothetical protein
MWINNKLNNKRIAIYKIIRNKIFKIKIQMKALAIKVIYKNK